MKGITLFLIIVGIMAAGCVSDTPEDDPPRWVDEKITPTSTPAPTPIRTPVPPVEMVPSPDPTPTPTPAPQNTTSTLCDYPPCGRGGGGGSGGSTGGGGSLPDDPICELPTVLLVLAGLGLVSLIRRG